MSSKDEYCFRIMRKYGLLVDFLGEPRTINVPDALENSSETLTHWIKRVLGPGVSNVVIYTPQHMEGNRKITKLQELVGASHLKKVVRAQAKVKDNQAELRKEKAVEDTKRTFSTLPADTIEDFIAEHEDDLEPAAKDFLERNFLQTSETIDAELLIKELVFLYSKAVQQYRKLTPVSTS